MAAGSTSMADGSVGGGCARNVTGEVGGDEMLSVSLSEEMLLDDRVPTIMN